jgi:RNA polymerase sigma-70 factor (ECF subfamily)
VQSDAEIVNAVLNGYKEAFAVLVKRYERPVRAIAMNVLGDYHSTADVSQDAFVKAYRELPGLRKPGAFGPWLMKIAHRCALDLVRRKVRETHLEARFAATTENPGGQLDETMGLYLIRGTLLAAVIKLPKSEKQVVMLRYFTGHSIKDVAEIVGRSVGTVTKQLSRAHKRLRKVLLEMEAEK